MGQKLVSIIIPNYNKKTYLKKCLISVFKQSYLNIEVIVVDNNSSDGSYEFLREYNNIKIIRNSKNELFAKSLNKGIKVSKGEYILCLNNDVILKEDFLEMLMNNVDNSNEKIGIFTGRILSYDGKFIDSCGQVLSKSRRPIERGYGKENFNLYSKKEIIFGACGAACLLKTNMLDEISIYGEYFDEDFGMFFEDLDLNWRANSFGWKALYIPNAICFHRRGTTTMHQVKIPFLKNLILPNIPPELQVYFIRNRYLVLIKNELLKNVLADLPFIILYEMKIWLYASFFRPKLFHSVLTYWSYFKRAFVKRRVIKNKVQSKKIFT